MVFHNETRQKDLYNTTGLTVQAKRRWAGITPAPGGIETRIDGTAWGNRRIVPGILDRDLTPSLGEDTAPSLRDLLTPWEGEGQRPAIDGSCAGIRNRQACREASLPLIHRVMHLTARRNGG